MSALSEYLAVIDDLERKGFIDQMEAEIRTGAVVKIMYQFYPEHPDCESAFIDDLVTRAIYHGLAGLSSAHPVDNRELN